ncbi:unnamed protein product [Heligmosomoides polygyrus]|uniref:Mastermind-like protein 3 n=1 Tax=Heligmosomoides polygyrus TaxID=6339 RepID=A0A183F8R1_HELPZ|nr:unnamed protein product [Heligmosomoides polygyrus]
MGGGMPQMSGGMPQMGGGMPQTQTSGLNVPNMPLLLSGDGGSPEALNALRNQQYLAQLSRHQSELTRYNAKQLEYLDQQRRYQQSMIDHQAGAALLMQKQQQDVIKEQMKQLQSSYGSNDVLGNDNTVGGRVSQHVWTASLFVSPALRLAVELLAWDPAVSTLIPPVCQRSPVCTSPQKHTSSVMLSSQKCRASGFTVERALFEEFHWSEPTSSIECYRHVHWVFIIKAKFGNSR